MHRRRCFHLQSDSPFARLDKLSCILRLAFITLPESQVGLSLLNFSRQQMIVANPFGGPTHFARIFRRRGLAAQRLKPPQTTVVFHKYTFQPTPPLVKNGSANGIRTRVPALRGQCPRPLDDSAVFEEGRDSSARCRDAQTVFQRICVAVSSSSRSSVGFVVFARRCASGSSRQMRVLRKVSTRGFTVESIFTIRSQSRL